jgi:hypothetical protein
MASLSVSYDLYFKLMIDFVILLSLISCKDIIRLLYFKKKVAELEFNTAQLIFKEVESFHCTANEICFEVICRAILPSFP